MKKLFFFLIIIHCPLLTLQAQNQHTVDSLLTILKTAPNDTSKVTLLLGYGDEYKNNQP